MLALLVPVHVRHRLPDGAHKYPAAGDKVPFIMVTAESKVENVLVARKAGVSNYIVKPFSAEALKAKMIAVLGAF